MLERTIRTDTHGRYLVVPAAVGDPAPMLVGFHGYIESAEIQMERLRAIPGSDRWILISIQGLHRFYRRRSSDVVAGWMTRQDRELAIVDNLAYVDRVLTEVEARHPVRTGVVFAGFSQGVAMAFRAGAASTRDVRGIVAVGGDVPPELDRDRLARLRQALLCRGAQDEWYTSTQFDEDQSRLRDAGVSLTPLEFDGGHEWAGPVNAAAATFLNERA